MKLARNFPYLRSCLVAALLLPVTSCKTGEELEQDSVTREFPPDSKLSFDVEPTITCDTAPVSKTVTMIKPSTGQPVSLTYKSSDEVDYLSPGWQSRIASSWDFFDEKSLGYSTNYMHVTLIDIANVNGKPHYHYFSNGMHSKPGQTVSASKFMAASFSVQAVRQRSGGKIGADLRYNSRVLASDLDIIGAHSNNYYANNVKGIGGRRHADRMLKNWLYANSGDTFGGNFGWYANGKQVPKNNDYCFDQGYPYPAEKVASLDGNGSLDLSWSSSELSYPENGNFISGLTFTEWLKRLAVNYRDPVTLPRLVNYDSSSPLSPSALRNAPPSLTKRDIQILFYGTGAYSLAEFKERGLTGSDCGGPLGTTNSTFEGKIRGGMMWDGMRDWPSNLGGSAQLTKLFGNKWRTLGKGGSSGRREVVTGYICLPKIVKNGQVVFPGKEMVAHIHHPNSPRKYSGENWTRIHEVVRKIADVFVPGLRNGNPTVPASN